MEPAFTILLPVHRPPDLMVFAIQSVLDQTRGDFELFIICDGAPPETVSAADDAAAKDPRVRVFPFAKGERNGEAHRHIVLQQASGRMVCQIADDDIWFPEHLAEMALLLDEVEFGNLLHTWLAPDGQFKTEFKDLADPAVRVRMRTQLWNCFGPTASGYRISTYHRLPVGWSPAPPGIWTDLAMWRKFLDLPDLIAGTRFAVTSLHFSTALRTDWTLERRQAENAHYAALAASERWRDNLRQQVLSRAAREADQLAAERNALRLRMSQVEAAFLEARQLCSTREVRIADLEQQVAAITTSPTWKLSRRLRRMAGLLPIRQRRAAR